MIRAYKRLKGTNQIKELKAILKIHTSMRRAYFWTPPNSYSARRFYEQERSNSAAFSYGGRTYVIDQECVCSVRNIYYSLSVTVDGKKKDVRAIKALVEQHG